MSDKKDYPNCDKCINSISFANPLLFAIRCKGQGGKYAENVYMNEHCKIIYEEAQPITAKSPEENNK
jgi:hypothetical protein